MANKVQFGLKNVYYSKVTFSGSTPTFATPVAIPGGVNLNMASQNEVTKFYADNMLYFTTYANNGYEGDLEVAKLPDAMLTDIFGYTLTGTSKVLVEDNNAEPAHFALLFQIEGDVESECYVLYNCVAGRPSVASGTVQSSKEPVTQSITITAAPLPNGRTMARTTASTTSTVKDGWFTSVWNAQA